MSRVPCERDRTSVPCRDSRHVVDGIGTQLVARAFDDRGRRSGVVDEQFKQLALPRLRRDRGQLLSRRLLAARHIGEPVNLAGWPRAVAEEGSLSENHVVRVRRRCYTEVASDTSEGE